ncbi:hypothetical protein E2C01_044991 [Portunus trituberculatus]|uniref:Uncharacterized protein n=1 Tax=Portunus trituberculatus TaxID=210409 RepID=A0A5B7FUI6_PORTR|nr:hypothetical protein [Portunus trituberculatus]
MFVRMSGSITLWKELLAGLSGDCLLCECSCLHLLHLQLSAQLQDSKVLCPQLCFQVTPFRGEAVNLWAAQGTKQTPPMSSNQCMTSVWCWTAIFPEEWDHTTITHKKRQSEAKKTDVHSQTTVKCALKYSPHVTPKRVNQSTPYIFGL